MAQRAPYKPASPYKRTRKSRGFIRTGGILSSQIRKAGEKRGFVETRLLTHWAEFVGEAVAKIAQPVKVHYAREGLGATLTLLTTGANAPVLQMQLPAIIERVNACYGYSAISKISITQTAPTGFSQSQKPFEHTKEAKILSSEAVRDVDNTVENVSNQDLRQALARLGKNIKQKI
ncbi:MAG: DciA family protein [Rhodobacterales bacterium]